MTAARTWIARPAAAAAAKFGAIDMSLRSEPICVLLLNVGSEGLTQVDRQYCPERIRFKRIGQRERAGDATQLTAALSDGER